MLHIVESTKPLAQVMADLEAAVTRNKFGVLGIHNLKEAMEKKGVAFTRNCLIVEVCNPFQAKKVLEANLEISTALPCRISAYEEGGKTKLATIKPTAMISLYPNPELKGVAEEVEMVLVQIMTEAARQDGMMKQMSEMMGSGQISSDRVKQMSEMKSGMGTQQVRSREDPSFFASAEVDPAAVGVLFSNGEQIYYTGISRRTGPVPFRGGPRWFWVHGGGCVLCHGVRGRGGVPVMMGTKTPSDIRYRRLVEGGHEPAGGKAEHLPYTDSLIRRAVSEGLTSDGQPLDWTMPRWALAGEDWEDLLAYLKTLD